MTESSFILAPTQAVQLDRQAALPFVSSRFAPARSLDIGRLSRACRYIADRHDAFSAIFNPAHGTIMIGESSRVQIDVRPVSAHPTQDASFAAAREAFAGGGPLLTVVLETGNTGVEHITVSACALICDRNSLMLYLRQVMAAYDSPDVVDENEIDVLSYGDFLDWRQSLAEEQPDWSSGRQYWKTFQASILGHEIQASLSFLLPSRGSRLADPEKAERPTPRADQSLAINVQTLAGVRRLAAQHHFSEDAFFHVVWYVLLARLSGEYRLAYAWLHDGREDYDALQDSIGAFERIMPMLGEAMPDEACLSVVKKFDDMLSTHRAWQEQIDVPLTMQTLQCGLGFSVCRNLEGQDRFEPSGTDLDVDAAPALTALRMTVSVMLESGEKAKLALRYAPEFVDPSWMLSLLSQYRYLLADLVAHPLRAIGEAELEDPGTLRGRRLIGASLDVMPRTIDAWISYWAEQTPGSPALRHGSMSLSYAELDEQVTRVAAALSARGVGAGDRVALWMPRSPTLVASLMGVMRCGAAYVPLDIGWPEQRMLQILAQSQPKYVLVNEVLPFSSASDSGGCPFLDLNSLLKDRGQEDAKPISGWDASTDDAAYVIFTSGSTGVPKGVVIEHGQIMNYLAASSAGLGLASCQVYGWTATVAADLGNTALFSAFFHGRTLAVANTEESTSSVAFLRFLQEARVDCLKMVPSHLDALLPQGNRVPLGTVILGGEPIAPRLIDKLRAIDGHARIYNHYGPTETTIGVLFHAFGADQLESSGSDGSPLTQAMANCEAFLVNGQGEFAGAGEIGELYVAGAQLARGYLNNMHGGFGAFPAGSGQRCYRTGDLGRYLPSGGLILQGRTDGQVKIRGYRVEPGEIEAALQDMPGISQAVVIAVSTADVSRLAAFVVVEEVAKDYLTGKFLRAELSSCLPDYMVPSAVECVEALPRLPNGKIDRRRLTSDLPSQRVSENSTSSEPNEPVGRLLLRVADRLLDASGAVLDDNFFERGGDSIAAIRYTAELSELLKAEIMPAALFTRPTFRAFRDFLKQEIFDDRQDELIRLVERALSEQTDNTKAT